MADAQRSGVSRAIRRVLQGLGVVWAAATLAFVLLRFAPGDQYATLVDGVVSAATRDAWRAQSGADAAIATQYVRYLGDVARGDLGWSTRQQRPVSAVLRDTLPNTLLLMGVALATSLVFGMLLGAWQGTRIGSTGDQIASTTSLVLYSMPEFWLALLLMQLFAQTLGWFPSSGVVDAAVHDYMTPIEQLIDRLRHLFLPWLALSLVGTAVFARFQRGSMREAWREPYVRTARAKGLTEGAVRRHAWRNAVGPVATLLGLVFPAILGGAVFVERIFAWPGMGDATIRAVSARDYDFVTAAVIVGSVMTVLGSMLADVLLHVADPRTRA